MMKLRIIHVWSHIHSFMGLLITELLHGNSELYYSYFIFSKDDIIILDCQVDSMTSKEEMNIRMQFRHCLFVFL